MVGGSPGALISQPSQVTLQALPSIGIGREKLPWAPTRGFRLLGTRAIQGGNQMATEKKEQQVQEIADRLGRCTIAIATDYRGLAMPEMTALRRKLRDAGVEYRVIKNTLARLAAEQTGSQPLVEYLEGPTAIAFGYGEETGGEHP